MNGIQIFACDHRKNVDWNLPYIRIGGPESDCIININNDEEIAPYTILLSEGAKIWWVSKHIPDFGNPEYIGFCHYRRFFTGIKNDIPIIDITNGSFNPNMCMDPALQYSIMKQNNIDCISMVPLRIVKDDFTYIWEQLADDDKTHSIEVHKLIFDLFYKNLPDDLKKYADYAFMQKQHFLCNIFTMRTDLFKEYSSIVFKSLIEYDHAIDTRKMGKRYLGFYLERLTSCYIYILKASGRNIGCIPLLTIDGNKHIIDTPQY